MYWQYILKNVMKNVMQYIFANVMSNVMQYFKSVLVNALIIPVHYITVCVLVVLDIVGLKLGTCSEKKWFSQVAIFLSRIFIREMCVCEISHRNKIGLRVREWVAQPKKAAQKVPNLLFAQIRTRQGICVK